jgi:hypothetical protein
MKNLFNAITKQIASTESTPFKEGSRSAVVKEKRLLFSTIYVSCELFDKGMGFSGSYAKGGRISKLEIEKAKEAAQDFCQTGHIAKPNW